MALELYSLLKARVEWHVTPPDGSKITGQLERSEILLYLGSETIRGLDYHMVLSSTKGYALILGVADNEIGVPFEW
jgi:hypothetical protein